LSFVTADLDARKKIQNLVGYNGKYGCFYCKIHGEYIKEKHHIYFPKTPGPVMERLSSEIPILSQSVCAFFKFVY